MGSNFHVNTEGSVMEIKRFNQGFGGFGPLEQCKDGKLMLAADVDKELALNNVVLERYKDWAEELETMFKAQSKRADEWRKLYDDSAAISRGYEKVIAMLALLALVLEPVLFLLIGVKS